MANGQSVIANRGWAMGAGCQDVGHPRVCKSANTSNGVRIRTVPLVPAPIAPITHLTLPITPLPISHYPSAITHCRSPIRHCPWPIATLPMDRAIATTTSNRAEQWRRVRLFRMDRRARGNDDTMRWPSAYRLRRWLTCRRDGRRRCSAAAAGTAGDTHGRD